MESSGRGIISPGSKSSHRENVISPPMAHGNREKQAGRFSRKHSANSDQGLDTSQQKMSLKHVTLPSVNVILASMPASPVAALQYLTCFLETAKKLKDEEKMKEIQRQLDYIKLYLRQA